MRRENKGRENRSENGREWVFGYGGWGEIIVYSRSIINTYSLLSHKWWVPLIKFMVRPTIHVRGGSMHL